MQLDVRIFDDLPALSRAAALLFIDSCSHAIRLRGRALVVLSGGNTPEELFKLLAEPPYAEQVNWDRVHIFWGDERCVSPDDPRSNLLMARQTLLDHVPLSAGNIHAVQGS